MSSPKRPRRPETQAGHLHISIGRKDVWRKLCLDVGVDLARFPVAAVANGTGQVTLTVPPDTTLPRTIDAFDGLRFRTATLQSKPHNPPPKCPPELLKALTDAADGDGEEMDFDTPADDDEDNFPSEAWTPTKKWPHKIAQQFVARKRPTLIRYKHDWLEWTGAHYATIEDGTIRAELYDFCATGFKPNAADVSNAEDALRAVTHKADGTYTPPCWIGDAPTAKDGTPYEASEILAFKDCLLHLPTMTKLKPTPNFFTLSSLTYSFDRNAPPPKVWRSFLLQVFKDSRKSIGVLQEIFGYMLLPDNSFQKSFMWVSPPRGGKGTTSNILQKLVGERNCISPTMAGIGKDAILHSMVGKQVAIVSDMQINRNTNISEVVGNILRISGNDALTFDRKYKDAWTGRLLVRFLILTNLTPNFPDMAGAITNRFVILRSVQSFLGREDTTLESRLTAELPGILLWAIKGWKRLKARGRFVQTPMGQRTVRDMAEASLPVRAFIRERCIFDPAAVTSKADLYAAWLAWEDGVEQDDLSPREGEKDNGGFARRLLAAFGDKVKETRPRDGGERVQSWSGIRLRRWPFDAEYVDNL